MNEKDSKIVEFAAAGRAGGAPKRISRRARRGLWIGAVLAVLAVGLCLFLYWRGWTVQKLRQTITGGEQEAFFFTAGEDAAFAALGRGLAVVSADGVRLLDADGQACVSQRLTLQTPAMTVTDDSCAVYDLGGTVLRICDLDGGYTTLDTQHTINSARYGEGGWLAVTTRDDGYKGAVTVYDRSFRGAFAWYSGTGYPLVAQVSPDNKNLAILCAETEGSVIHFFALDSEEEQAAYRSERLLLDLAWTGRDSLCALSETGAVYLDGAGTLLGSFSFGDMALLRYDLTGDGFSAFLLSRYRASGTGELVTVDSGGNELGRLALETELTALSVSGKKLMTLSGGTLTLYSRTLETLGCREDAGNLRSAVLRTDGQALGIGTYSAAVYNFDLISQRIKP